MLVEEGAEVAEGDALLVLEAMKMEHTVRGRRPWAARRRWHAATCTPARRHALVGSSMRAWRVGKGRRHPGGCTRLGDTEHMHCLCLKNSEGHAARCHSKLALASDHVWDA